ncbi:MAG: hypothetical protein HY765_06130 [Rhodomicrobium sp.]|nr:hypothetical protein [Rhodomicrobium sp.]
MIERNLTAQTGSPVPLSLAAGQRIVTQGLDPVLGWSGGESARPAQPLIFPPDLLEASPTAMVAYACNLPAPGAESGYRSASEIADELPGTPGSKVGRDMEPAFLAASLPGGKAAVVTRQGARSIIRFRWACLTSHASIGAVWRCFVQVPASGEPGQWTATGHDYVFEAGGGALLNAPGDMKIPAADPGHAIALIHPEEMLTCFPCRSGRVKVTRLQADGWMKRSLAGLLLFPDRSVAARFSDGVQETIATAAPANALAACAA